MEEILASIRRIIEDSDTGPKPPAARYPANEPEPVAKAEVEAFRAELRPLPEIVAERRPEPTASIARSSEPALAAETAMKPFRLAEVQAQVAREAAQPKPAEAENKPVTLADVQQQLARETARIQGTTVAAVPPATLAPALRPAPAPVKADAPAIPEAANTERPREAVTPEVRRDDAPARANVVAALRPEPAAKPAIISPVAGRQVAAAFGELSEAFAVRGKKTFDELAEQMMRPMLQEWLDNNLPVLVERLVREEIERVARGVE